MSKDPAFLFYHQDFFAGVSDMTNEEIGAYVKCMCVQASKGGITEKHMSIICISQDVHITVKKKFVLNIETNLLENIRLKTEIEKRKKYSESRSNNRKSKSTEPKQPVKNSKTYEKHMENEIENEDVIKNEVLNENEYVKLLLEHGFEKNLIIEWFVIREKKNVANTTTFFKSFIEEVNRSGKNQNDILKICVENSWAGFKVEWLENIKNKNNGKATNKSNVEYSEDFIGKHLKNLQP